MVGMLSIAEVLRQRPESSQAKTPRGDSFQILKGVARFSRPMCQQGGRDFAAVDRLAQSRAERQEGGIAGCILGFGGQGFQLRRRCLHDDLGFLTKSGAACKVDGDHPAVSEANQSRGQVRRGRAGETAVNGWGCPECLLGLLIGLFKNGLRLGVGHRVEANRTGGASSSPTDRTVGQLLSE